MIRNREDTIDAISRMPRPPPAQPTHRQEVFHQGWLAACDNLEEEGAAMLRMTQPERGYRQIWTTVAIPAGAGAGRLTGRYHHGPVPFR